ncbi:hypothetical protein [Polaribacter sp.]|uniref:hypothetical protein n=1 Tax=Polaribacter sp. TaxID=1920175 RepID=UPI003F697B66
MKYFKIFIFLFFTTIVNAQTPSYDKVFDLEDYNFVLGTNAIAGKYQFTDESKLVEQAKHIRAMGSNILKISLGKKSQMSYGLKKTKAKTTLALFKSEPDYKKVFDMDFKYIFTWVHTLTNVKWKKRINIVEEKKLYDEMYEFATYILKKYNTSGKTFLIGNWEGDWLLHPNFNRKMTPPKEHVANMTKWFNIRQKAIDDAKRNTKHKNVFIYHYIELNLVLKAMDGKTSIAKDVLPNVNVDFVSYSSYEAIKKRNYSQKKATLDSIFNYLEKQLQYKENLPFKRRVFIGEYGYHANKNKPESFKKQFNETKEMMLVSLELQLPFSLHWQMYNNEYSKTGVSKEMSLINEAGEKRPLYYLHQNYYKKMNTYLKIYHKKNKQYPSKETFNNEAIRVLKSL